MANDQWPNPNEDYSTDVLECQGGKKHAMKGKRKSVALSNMYGILFLTNCDVGISTGGRAPED